MIKQVCRSKWHKYWNSCKKGRHFYRIQSCIKQGKTNHISRKDFIIYTRLRMGHTNLNATLHIGKHHSGLCNVCQEMET